VLAPNDFANIKANVKVASTENGIIFGNIVYDVKGAAGDRNVVVLNDIHIDIMDYIVPASCTEAEFRSMWAEFEWENKVNRKLLVDVELHPTFKKCIISFCMHRT
jgi:coatomer subunit beta